MYIQPDSEVRLLTNVPLDNTYAHTIYFANKEAQTSYFQSKTKAGCIFNNVSYQRHTRGSIRLKKLADNIYDCNYMMFKNTAFGDRWFYAFIREVEYISNTVCEVTYEIDVMQTWFFDVTLLQSFVEREHSVTDVAGDNLIPEPVHLGDYWLGTANGTGFFNVFDVVIVCPYKPDGDTQRWIDNFDTQVVDKNPTMLTHTAISTAMASYENNPFEDAFRYLSEQDKIESVVDCYLIPRQFLDVPQTGIYNYHIIDGNLPVKEYVFSQQHPTSLSCGYTPKNKKLLTYPYNKFVIDTGDGNLHDYCYEFFEQSEGKIKFQIFCYRGGNMAFKACPVEYKGETVNKTESCLLTDFPPFPYLIDSFKAWLAQNKTRVAFQIGTDLAGVGSGLGTVMAGSQMLTPKTKVLSKRGAEMMAGGYEQMGKAGVSGIGGTLAELADRHVNHFRPSGSSSGSLEISMMCKDFRGIQYSVNEQNAMVIDDFFNCYGYATHRVKVPNRNVRPHWTFVKTIDINVESNAPADDTNKICSIYDNGITFWKKPSEVGDYSLDNSPVSS